MITTNLSFLSMTAMPDESVSRLPRFLVQCHNHNRRNVHFVFANRASDCLSSSSATEP